MVQTRKLNLKSSFGLFLHVFLFQCCTIVKSLVTLGVFTWTKGQTLRGLWGHYSQLTCIYMYFSSHTYMKPDSFTYCTVLCMWEEKYMCIVILNNFPNSPSYKTVTRYFIFHMHGNYYQCPERPLTRMGRFSFHILDAW